MKPAGNNLPQHRRLRRALEIALAVRREHLIDEAETRRQLAGKNRVGGGCKHDRPPGGLFADRQRQHVLMQLAAGPSRSGCAARAGASARRGRATAMPRIEIPQKDFAAGSRQNSCRANRPRSACRRDRAPVASTPEGRTAIPPERPLRSYSCAMLSRVGTLQTASCRAPSLALQSPYPSVRASAGPESSEDDTINTCGAPRLDLRNAVSETASGPDSQSGVARIKSRASTYCSGK